VTPRMTQRARAGLPGGRDAKRQAAVVLAAVAAVLTLVAIAIVLVVHLGSSYEPTQSLVEALADIFVGTLPFVVVGALLTIRRPDNLVGWSVLLSGAGLLVEKVLAAYAELALLARPEAGLPAGAAAGSIHDGAWTALMAGVFLLLVLFPSGRLPSRRWWPAVSFVLVGLAVTWIVSATTPGRLDPPLEAFENPLAVTGSPWYARVAIPIYTVALVLIAAAGVSLVLRFRRSRGQERQQFKWLAAGAGFLVATMPFAAAFDFYGLAGGLFSLALVALPVAVGIAVLRYRLYDIDLIVRRTLVYGVLTAGLAGLYFAIVLALQQLFSSFAGGSDLAIAGSTLAVAALFRPARRRVQAFVDRRFYRRRYDAEPMLQAFAGHLRDEIDLDALTAELTSVVVETMQPAHLSLWLRRGS
jgi:hypothetical protein